MQHDNDINDTAQYQLTRFLKHNNSIDYNLDAIDVALLYAIAYYIDCDKDGKNTCCAKQQTLANLIRCDRKTVNRRLKKLSKQCLIIVERRWKLLWITFDENLVLYLSGTLSSTYEVHDQVPNGYTTIEDKKQKIREKHNSDVFLLNEEHEEEFNEEDLMAVPEVDNFIKQLIQG